MHLRLTIHVSLLTLVLALLSGCDQTARITHRDGTETMYSDVKAFACVPGPCSTGRAKAVVLRDKQGDLRFITDFATAEHTWYEIPSACIACWYPYNREGDEK